MKDPDTAVTLLHRFSVADYYRLGELGILDQRTELIEGQIIDMEPIGPWHASILDILNQTFCEQARQQFSRPSTGTDRPGSGVSTAT